jgi:photosystem II stability/assembly factor-like uncharacterized protein
MNSCTPLCSFVAILFALIIGASLGVVSRVSAQWSIVGTFNQPFDCGFFLDANTGLIGSGNTVNKTDLRDDPIQIYKTTNGGSTWYAVKTPQGNFGAVSSIFMQSAQVGYATIFAFGNSPTTALWKSTDGGETWIDINPNLSGWPTDVYATSKALTVTEWFDLGGSSINGGQSFTQYFGSSSGEWSNGIDFTDDNTGVATMRETPTSTNPFYYTSDGGVTWLPSTVQVEAWSVYGRKCTTDFFCANEGFTGIFGHTIYWSSDGGKTWAQRYAFPDPTMKFTGHIGGMLNTLYLQTDISVGAGLYRSDDLGLSWKPVAGPSDLRDSRFIVTGTQGEVVYAFDSSGNVWKTTNGGDGTLQGSTAGSISPLMLPADSITLTAHDCQPDTLPVVLSNSGCVGITLDSVQVFPNTLSEFDASINSVGIAAGDIGTINVVFTPHNAPQHLSQLKIFGHSAAGSFDTTVQVTGINLSTIDPYFGPAQQGFIADTVDIPIYLHQTNDPFSVSNLSLTYGIDGDILTPVGFTTSGTLSMGAKIAFDKTTTLNSVVIDDTLKNTLTQPTTDFTMPLIIVRFFVTLTRSTNTTISMTNISVNGSAPLALCITPTEDFTAELRCGDSTIKAYMLGKNLLPLLSTAPNPNAGSRVDVWYELPADGIVTIDLVDSKGNSVTTLLDRSFERSGKYQTGFNASILSTGSYILRLQVDGAVLSTTKLIRE